MKAHVLFRSQLSLLMIVVRHPPPKYPDQDVISHIESYLPTLAHYGSKYALVQRYLPAETRVKSMYQDLKNKYACEMSYRSFYGIFKSIYISITLLEHEEWEVCQCYNLYQKNCTCEAVCDVSKYIEHKKALHKSQKGIPARLKIHSC
ncbi:hypothetical protein RRG08_016936 [Elysia crispata]|uniref:Uncharacterized protein n=1 Tax=Elysia crispata TaxID=231223 RepID=A0AAE1BC43_9GAST|nr:hypothetical protein RRG08_016936 [Elysia crispata]